MILQNQVYFEDAREKLFKGIETVAKAVEVTLGSKGRNVIYVPIDKTIMGEEAWPKITNDGVSIAQQIFPEDKMERMGADIIKQTCNKTNYEVGDGTTSSAIWTYEIINEGMKIKDVDPMSIRRELDKAKDEVIKLLDKKAIKITDDKELLKVARISSEDETIAELVSRAVIDSGETGKVFVEESAAGETTSEKNEGFTFDQGYISPMLITHPGKFEAIFNDVHVLITSKKFILNKEIFPILKEISQNEIAQCVIICEDMASEALATVIQNKLKDKFIAGVVKMPRDRDVFEDLGEFTGCTLETPDSNSKFSMTHLARVRKVVITKDKITIIKGDRTDNEKSRYSARIEAINNDLKEYKGESKEKLKDRLSRFTSSSVVIKVGAATEAEMKYRRDKIDDAVAAVTAAKAEGYITGGGLTLRAICKEVDEKLKTTGSGILARAASRPVEILIKNAGVEYDASKINETDGFDTDSGKYTKNLIEKGIIDPVLVAKAVLTNAVSTAGLFLTLGAAIKDLKSVVK